jgi:curved DNA-binding protein
MYRQWRRQGGHPGGQPDFGGFQEVNVGDFGAFDFGSIFEDLFGGRPPRAAHGHGHGRAQARSGAHAEGELEVDLREAVLGGERDVRVGDRTLRVRIPPGVGDGSTIRLAGQGGPGAHGGAPGDVYLRVKLRDHPLVRRNGKDLSVDLPVTVPEAALGAEVTLPTFEGPVQLRVPAGAQSGKKLRLRGKGLPDLKGGPRGDLYAVVQVILPEPSERLEKAVKPLESLYKKDPRAGLSL